MTAGGKLSQLDKSYYYRGMLILAGKDRIIHPRERELMLEVGRILDFDRRFCEAAISDLLDNRYLPHEPVVFSKKEIAKCFLRDAMRLALVDEELHRLEGDWLMSVARANGLTKDWFSAERRRFAEKKDPSDVRPALSIQQYI